MDEEAWRCCKHPGLMLAFLAERRLASDRNPFRPHPPFDWSGPTLFDGMEFNPFRPYPTLGRCPREIADLAAALYGGEECAFALHDALEEAGHEELAAHFTEPEHPRGCWAFDLLLGKQ